MKKNVLFVIPSLTAGGGEKSLVNLLSHIDFKRFNVDLFLFNHDGIFMNYIPKKVNVLPLPETYATFSMPLIKSMIAFYKKGQFSLANSRLQYMLTNRKDGLTSIKEQHSWKYLAESIPKLEKKYDVAIGFLEKTSIYFCVDKVEAKKKIGWIHIDYNELGMDPHFDINYFRQLSHIVTVSEECATILKKKFPSERKKIEVIHNIVSPRIIEQLASESTPDVSQKSKDEVRILSIGRLHEQKGFELAVEACHKLVSKGYNIKWYVIGEGDKRTELTKLAKELNVEEHFILLGLRANPYPYIKHADIYAQTSRFEGKSIAVDEAKILNKPILLTNYSTATDQITDGVNGVIVEMNADGICAGIEKLMTDKKLKANIIQNLSQEKKGSEEEIEKLYSII